jgi:hypothetical protein
VRQLQWNNLVSTNISKEIDGGNSWLMKNIRKHKPWAGHSLSIQNYHNMDRNGGSDQVSVTSNIGFSHTAFSKSHFEQITASASIGG